MNLLKLLGAVLCCIPLTLLSQDNQIPQSCADYPCWIDMMQDPDVHVPSAQQAYEMYWSGRSHFKGDGHKVFKRWEYNAVLNMDENGYLPDHQTILDEYESFHQQYNNRSTTANWTELGPVNTPNNAIGLGRINYVAFDPVNQNKIYLAAPQGGVWMSDNGGNSWYTTTDQMATLGVSCIVVDHSNPNRVYIGTGDRDGNDAARMGVFVSTDAGQTWNPSNAGMTNRLIGDLIQHPSQPQILLAAANNGIYKTTDAGQTWNNMSGNFNFKNIVFHPTNPNIVYAAAKGGSPNQARFFKSTDNGDSWNEITAGVPAGMARFVIGVSVANPDRVYFLADDGGFEGLYQSNNSGDSFTMMSNSPNILGWTTDGSSSGSQGWYDLCIAVDPQNADVVYIGGINIWKSTDGGSSWTLNAHWYGGGGAPEVHADQHWLTFNPHNNELWSCNDGGVDISPNGSSWSFTGQGLGNAQIYKIGQSTQSTKLVNGYQDNGTAYISPSGNWTTFIGGDGMECIIDYTSDQYMYGALYYGNIRRSTNGGGGASTIAKDGVNGIDESGAWVTPYVLHESDPNTMFIGYKNVWRSTNVKVSGTSNVNWTKISDNLAGENNKNISVLEHSPADNDLLYMARSDKKIFRCDNAMDGTPTWTNITSSSPSSNNTPTDIEAHPTDPNIVYMTINKKVYKSTDKGNSWTNISGNLPSVPMYCVLFDTSTPEGLYVSTNAGVYYINNTLTDWVSFSDGLPLASQINEIEIYYDNSDPNNSRIRAGSYGRGLWESTIYSPDVVPTADFSYSANSVCLGDTIQLIDQSSGNPSSWTWTGSPTTFQFVNGTDANTQNPYVVFDTDDTYTFDLEVSNTAGNDIYTNPNAIVVDPDITADYTSFESPLLTVSFTNQSTGFTTASWDFGDGNMSTDISPMHTYQSAGIYQVGLTVSSSCGDEYYESDVEVGAGLGVFENEQSQYYIAPNPVDEFFMIGSTNNNINQTSVQIYNAMGQLMFESVDLKTKFDVSKYPPGKYIVLIIDAEAYVTPLSLLVR